MFLAGRVANELLLPTNWGELEGGIARGISDLPGVRVPYRGLDQWVRTVIPLGGSLPRAAGGGARVLPAPQAGHARVPLGGAARARDAVRRAGRLDRLLPRVPARRGPDADGDRLRHAREGTPAGRARRARAGRCSACSSRCSSPRLSTSISRGGTTRRGRSRRPRRSRPPTTGTRTTTGSTGRATGASCCASAPSSPPTGRRTTSTSSTARAGCARRSPTPRPSTPRSSRRPSRPGPRSCGSRFATYAPTSSSPPATRSMSRSRGC